MKSVKIYDMLLAVILLYLTIKTMGIGGSFAGIRLTGRETNQLPPFSFV